MKHTISTICAMSLVAASVTACDAEPQVSPRAADEAGFARVELDERDRVQVDEALSDPSEPDVDEPHPELLELARERVAELRELDPRRPDEVLRIEEIGHELTEIAMELDPTWDGPLEPLGFDDLVYCQYAAWFSDLVVSFASLTETYAKASHQFYGASYSWVTWFMTIVARIDAEAARDLALANILFNAPSVAALMQDAAAESADAAAHGYQSHLNLPNGYAEGAYKMSDSTSQLASKVSGWAGLCKL